MIWSATYCKKRLPYVDDVAFNGAYVIRVDLHTSQTFAQ
jgi:hypothetical protein